MPELFDTIAELQELSAVAVPRRLFPDKFHAIALHVFTDGAQEESKDVATDDAADVATDDAAAVATEEEEQQ